MKYFSFLLLTLFLLPLILYAAQSEYVFFILPQGYPYKQIGFSSRKHEEICLKFGDKVRIEDEYVRGNITWFRCYREPYFFYLPEGFIVKKATGIHYDSHGNIKIGKEIVDKRNALPVLYRPNDLIPVPLRYSAEGYENRVLLLREEAEEIFSRMIEDAEKDGVKIRILSAFRSAQYQSYLYFNSIKKRGVLQDSVAKPGHSEHQLGTTCDLTTDEINNVLSQDFKNTCAYQWLKEHISYYGVSLSYPEYKERVTGYKYESWHYRYWGKARWEYYQRKYGLFLSR